MTGSLVDFQKVDGNLHITLTDEGRQELPDLIDSCDGNSEKILLELIECKLCNGWETIRPEEIGALTDSIIITDEGIRDDDGELTSVGRVYSERNPDQEDPIETLQTKGVFVMVGSD